MKRHACDCIGEERITPDGETVYAYAEGYSAPHEWVKFVYTSTDRHRGCADVSEWDSWERIKIEPTERI